MRRFTFALLLCLLAAISLFAQQSAPTPPPAADEDDVVKITTKLVQLDAVVTDEKGNQVTNLTPDDFEILQDGKPQKITNLSYVQTVTPNAVPSVTTRIEKNVFVPPSRGARLPENGRLLTFIVDNCNSSRTSMYIIREALIKFVEKQMLPTDAVAIYQTRGGASLLQQFTSDREQLLRTIRKISMTPSPSCDSNIDFYEQARADVTIKANGEGEKSFESPETKARREAAEDSRRDAQTIGMLGVMRYIINGLSRVGGRKVVFLLSDGMPLRTRSGKVLRVRDALRDLSDLANRASVVFNTIDPRGVDSPILIGAGDEILPDTPNAALASGTDAVVEARRNQEFLEQEGMNFLANETGGRFYKNNNNLEVPMARALSVEKGYYLLAYQPDDAETFKGKNFNRIEIKVRRPDLKVVSRSGFLGRTDEDARQKRKAGDGSLYEAIIAPLPATGLELQLTAFFGNTPAQGNFVRSLLHLDGGDITFIDQPNGNKKAVFDIVAVTLDEKNEVIDDFNRTHSVTIPAAAIPLIKRNGLIYAVDVPVKKNGTYYYRVAVRDVNSKMVGTASQVIQVPDLKKDKIFLSGLMLSQIDINGKFTVPSIINAGKPISAANSTAIPAIRQFRRGMFLAYSYTLYNPALDKATGKPNLTVQVNLYRDGKIVTAGKAEAAQLEPQADWSRVNDYGYLRLKPNMEPGDYVLQIIVRDALTNQVTSQWIDFQVTQ